jgi:TonB family protein
LRPPRTSAKPPKVKPAQVIKKVTPVYPNDARSTGLRGTVKVAAVILPDGTLNDLVVLSSPNANLALAALLAVRQWRYSPTYLDGQAVEANLTIDVNFEP